MIRLIMFMLCYLVYLAVEAACYRLNLTDGISHDSVAKDAMNAADWFLGAWKRRNRY